ncbi:MAG: hypothetical protein NTU53_04750 [Planctomycetota bacterium]|nr:hypothetical protein [Planctomycetota bacterium]
MAGAGQLGGVWTHFGDMGEGVLESANVRAVVLLFGGAVGLLVAVLGGLGAMAGASEGSPGRRAVAHWLPIGVMAMVATLLGHSDMGMGVVFGTSVAALSGVAGLVVMSGTVEVLPTGAGRVWALLPAATILAFMAGFQGKVGVFEAIVLLLEGMLVMGVWVGEAEKRGMGERESGRMGGGWMRWGMMVAVMGVAVVSAWAATRGAEELSRRGARYSSGVIAGTLLSVALVMPMVGTGVPLAGEGRAWVALTAQVGVVYLNLCVLLPMVIVTAGAAAWVARHVARDAATTQSVWGAVIFPRMAWRIDALGAVILSLVFMAAAGGRVRFDRRLAGGLIFGYFVYLLIVLGASARG